MWWALHTTHSGVKMLRIEQSRAIADTARSNIIAAAAA
jgi:hypothetical protein